LILETERLTIRTLTLDDADLMLAIWTDPAFVRNVADRGIRTLDEARKAMQEGALHLYEEYGYGPYRVALKEGDRAIGICGLFRRDGLDEPDIGYALLPGFYAQGYMIESARRVLDYARQDLRLPYVTAIVNPDNDASVRLLKKLGLEFEKMMRLPDEDEDLARYGIRFSV
jgi:RimJ/RimL family protein N-acetyltransferase